MDNRDVYCFFYPCAIYLATPSTCFTCSAVFSLLSERRSTVNRGYRRVPLFLDVDRPKHRKSKKHCASEANHCDGGTDRLILFWGSTRSTSPRPSLVNHCSLKHNASQRSARSPQISHSHRVKLFPPCLPSRHFLTQHRQYPSSIPQCCPS